jgi:hypothetical protein
MRGVMNGGPVSRPQLRRPRLRNRNSPSRIAEKLIPVFG